MILAPVQHIQDALWEESESGAETQQQFRAELKLLALEVHVTPQPAELPACAILSSQVSHLQFSPGDINRNLARSHFSLMLC